MGEQEREKEWIGDSEKKKKQIKWFNFTPGRESDFAFFIFRRIVSGSSIKFMRLESLGVLLLIFFVPSRKSMTRLPDSTVGIISFNKEKKNSVQIKVLDSRVNPSEEIGRK